MRSGLLVGLMLVLAACGGEATPEVNVEATKTRAAEQTEVAAVRQAPTATVAPTPTAVPTATNVPTAVPTRVPPTPTPTRVPPTPTPIPPTPTPRPEPTPTMTTEQVKAQYRADVDVRDLYKDLGAYRDWKLYYEGQVLLISNPSSGGSFIQVQVPYGPGVLDNKVIIAVAQPNSKIDTTGIYEKTRVGVGVRCLQWFTITNAYGGKVDQPLCSADFIEKL